MNQWGRESLGMEGCLGCKPASWGEEGAMGSQEGAQLGSSFRVQWEQVKHSGRGGAGRSECFEVS